MNWVKLVELMLGLLLVGSLGACQFSAAMGRIPNDGGRLTFASENEKPGWLNKWDEEKQSRLVNLK